MDVSPSELGAIRPVLRMQQPSMGLDGVMATVSPCRACIDVVIGNSTFCAFEVLAAAHCTEISGKTAHTKTRSQMLGQFTAGARHCTILGRRVGPTARQSPGVCNAAAG